MYVLSVLFVIHGCSPADTKPSTRNTAPGTTDPDSDADPDADPDTDPDTDPDSDPADPDADPDADLDSNTVLLTLQGEVTWTVDFDDPAETDCFYTRSYVGEEDRSAPWLCPACEAVYHLDVEIVAGRTDCFDRVSDREPTAQERHGFGDGVWYRSSTGAMIELGTATRDGDALTVAAMSTEPDRTGGPWSFTIGGTVMLGETVGDPIHGFRAPDTYACGWPKADPAPFTGDYTVVPGGTLPDGVFLDVCDEPVRLHDFAGSYLLIDVSATDCGPCQSAAAAEEGFVEELSAEGVDVWVVTLLVPSLSNTAASPTQRELTDWIEAFSLTSPVLADRLWGRSVVGGAMGEDFAYPAFVLVAPDLTVLMMDTGYVSFDPYRAAILAHLGM